MCDSLWRVVWKRLHLRGPPWRPQCRPQSLSHYTRQVLIAGDTLSDLSGEWLFAEDPLEVSEREKRCLCEQKGEEGTPRTWVLQFQCRQLLFTCNRMNARRCAQSFSESRGATRGGNPGALPPPLLFCLPILSLSLFLSFCITLSPLHSFASLLPSIPTLSYYIALSISFLPWSLPPSVSPVGLWSASFPTTSLSPSHSSLGHSLPLSLP